MPPLWPRMGRRGVDSTPIHERRTANKYRQRKAEIPQGTGDDMQRKFIVSGAYVDFADVVTMTLTDEATDEQLAQQPGALQAAYEKLGRVGVQVIEVEA